jgi:putative nucleotidyltransferase with HDIG domain
MNEFSSENIPFDYHFLNRRERLLWERFDELDPYTRRHSQNVASLARCVGAVGHLEPELVGRVVKAAKLHDVGKLDIPQELLIRPGPLTDEERVVVRKHPEDGVEILRASGFDDPIILDACYTHHFLKEYPIGAVPSLPSSILIAFLDELEIRFWKDRPYLAQEPAESLSTIYSSMRARYVDTGIMTSEMFEGIIHGAEMLGVV